MQTLRKSIELTALVCGITVAMPAIAYADICDAPVHFLSRAQLATILKSGCPAAVSSVQTASHEVESPTCTVGSSNSTAPSSRGGRQAVGGVSIGIAGGGQANTGGINVRAGGTSASGNSNGVNVGAGTAAASRNSGGINVGLGANTATGNSGGLNADVGGGGTGAGSHNSEGIGIGIGGSQGIGVSANSGGIGAKNVGGLNTRR